MANYYKKDEKWCKETDFLGTIFTDEIEDPDEIEELEAYDDELERIALAKIEAYNRDMVENPDSYFEPDDPRRYW